MGKVVPMRIEITEEDFFTLWKRQCAEWEAIKDEMSKTRPSASEVTDTQRARMAQRGEEPLDIPRLWIIGKGWIIPR
jgi:hypothetical protein